MVKSSSGCTNGIDITSGVLQGNSLSPLLFILFVRDSDINFNNNNHIAFGIISKIDILVLLYADDIILLAYSTIDTQKNIKP